MVLPAPFRPSTSKPLAPADVERARPRTRPSDRTPWRDRRPRARPGPRAAARAASRAACARPWPTSILFALMLARRGGRASWRCGPASAVWWRIESASVLEPADLRLLARRELRPALLVGLPRDEVLRVRAAVLDELAFVEVQDARDRLVEQREVVADDEQRAAVRCAGTTSAMPWRRRRGGSSARRAAGGRRPRRGSARARPAGARRRTAR